MKHRVWVVGAVALGVAAGCAKAPVPLSDAEKQALADSVGRIATEYITSMTPRVDVARMLSYYEQRPDLVIAGEGMVWVSYDSLAKLAPIEYPAGSAVTGTLDDKHFTILSRDVVVITSRFHAVMKDSAGTETPTEGVLTFVFHRTPDGWKIALEHSSASMPAPAERPARRR
jgi:hypothetical protein